MSSVTKICIISDVSDKKYTSNWFENSFFPFHYTVIDDGKLLPPSLKMIALHSFWRLLRATWRPGSRKWNGILAAGLKLSGKPAKLLARPSERCCLSPWSHQWMNKPENGGFPSLNMFSEWSRLYTSAWSWILITNKYFYMWRFSWLKPKYVCPLNLFLLRFYIFPETISPMISPLQFLPRHHTGGKSKTLERWLGLDTTAPSL